MARFLLTAQLQLRAPANTRQVVGQIRRQLQGGVNVNVNLNAANANRQAQRLTTNVNAANNAGQRLNRTFATSLKRFAAFSIASRGITLFTSRLSAGIEAAIDFERELVKISQVTGKTMGELQGLSNTITNLSTSLGTSSKSLLSTGRILAQAGIQARDLDIALAALAKTTLAPTFDDISKTAEGAVAILAQFGRGVGALEEQLGAINAVAGQFAVESGDLISAVRRTGGVFKSAGGDLNELIGLFTSVRATTRESAESIATGLRTIFTRIQRPKTIEFLKQFGVELTDLNGKFVGPFEAVKQLSRAFKGLEEGDITFVRVAEELGGFRQIGKVIPLLQQFEIAERARAAAVEGATSLDRDAATAQQALAVQIEKTREKFLQLVRDVAGTGTFKTLISTTLGLADAFIKVADALKPIIPLVGALAGVRLAGFLGGAARGIGAAIARRNSGGPIGFNSGGLVPGTGNTDTVPAMLTAGEFVIRKSSVRKIGANNLAAMNARGYNAGGIVKEDKAGNYPDTRGYAVPARYVFNKDPNTRFDKSVNRFNTEDKIRFRRLDDDRVDVNAEFPGPSKNSALYKAYAKAVRSGNNTARGNAFEKIIESKRGVTLATKNRGEGNVDAPSSRLDGIKNSGNYPIEIKSISEILTDRDLGKKVSGASLNQNPSSADAKIAKRLELQKLTNSKKTKKPDIVNLGPVQVVADVTNLGAIRGSQDTRTLGQARVRGAKTPFTANAGGGVPGSSDTVPAMLTPGEFVINKKAASSIGFGNLHRMNKHGVAKFAEGGVVTQGRNFYGRRPSQFIQNRSRRAERADIQRFDSKGQPAQTPEQKVANLSSRRSLVTSADNIKPKPSSVSSKSAFRGGIFAGGGGGVTGTPESRALAQNNQRQQQIKNSAAQMVNRDRKRNQNYNKAIAANDRALGLSGPSTRSNFKGGKFGTGSQIAPINVNAGVDPTSTKIKFQRKLELNERRDVVKQLKDEKKIGTKVNKVKNATVSATKGVIRATTSRQGFSDARQGFSDARQGVNSAIASRGGAVGRLLTRTATFGAPGANFAASRERLRQAVDSGRRPARTPRTPGGVSMPPAGGGGVPRPPAGGGGGPTPPTGGGTRQTISQRRAQMRSSAAGARTGGMGGMGAMGATMALSMMPRFDEAEDGVKQLANASVDGSMQVASLMMMHGMLAQSMQGLSLKMMNFAAGAAVAGMAANAAANAIDSYTGVHKKAQKRIEEGDIAGAQTAAIDSANAKSANLALTGLAVVAGAVAVAFGAPIIATAAVAAGLTALAKGFGLFEGTLFNARDFLVQFGLASSDAAIKAEAAAAATAKAEEQRRKGITKDRERAVKSGNLNDITATFTRESESVNRENQARMNSLIEKQRDLAAAGDSEGLNENSREMDTLRKQMQQDQSSILSSALSTDAVQSAIRVRASKGGRIDAKQLGEEILGKDQFASLSTRDREAFIADVNDLGNAAQKNAEQLRALNFGLSNINAAAQGASSALDRFLESRETGTFDASSVLEQALSSAAGSLDPKELERAKKELATSMRGFGASDQQIQESTQTVSAISQVQQLGEAAFKKAVQGISFEGGQKDIGLVFARLRENLSSQLTGVPEDIKTRIFNSFGKDIDETLLSEALATQDFSKVFQSLLDPIIKATQDNTINLQKTNQENNRKLAGLYKERIDNERQFIDAQKKSIELQKEAASLIAEFSGREFTSKERVSFAEKDARLGLGANANLSAAGLVARSRVAAQQVIGGRQAFANGFSDPRQAAIVQGRIQSAESDQEEILAFARERIQIYKDEIAAAKEKLKLDQEAAKAALSGDSMAQLEATLASIARDAFVSGNTAVLKNVGGAARIKGFEALSEEERKKTGGTLRGLGLSGRLAGSLTESTPEISKLESEATKMAKVISEVGKSLESIAKNKFDKTNIDIQTAQISIGQAIGRQRANAPATGTRYQSKGGVIYANNGIFVPRGTDTVPAMLTPGEFVVNRASVQRGNNLQVLKAINSGGEAAAGYARGGRVRYYDNGALVGNNSELTQLMMTDGRGDSSATSNSSSGLFSGFSDSVTKMVSSLSSFSQAVSRLEGFNFSLSLDPQVITVNINTPEVRGELKDMFLEAVVNEININQLGKLEKRPSVSGSAASKRP
jgi:hypothetical protein